MRLCRKVLVGLVCLFCAGVVLGNEAIPNWAAPASWSPTRSAGVHTLADATPPRPFIGLPPCRIVDTRGTGGVPINTGGAFAANEMRTWVFTGLCGIPVGADAVSLNITVTGTGGQTAFGFITIWPGGGTEPNVSTLNWSTAGVTESNAAVVPFGTSPAGSVSVRSANNSSQVLVDTNGYYASTPATTTNYFSVIGSGLYAIDGETSNTGAFAAGVYGKVTAGPANGVFGQSLSPANGTSGVFGWASATTGITTGVAGETDSTTDGARGVLGAATATTGTSAGVRGQTNSTTSNASGVFGRAQALSGQTYGVRGLTFSSTDDTAGVFGGATSTTGQVIGVLGTSQSLVGGIGVVGALTDTAGTPTVYGLLGSAFGVATDSTGAPWGVFSQGNLGALGVKHFVEPHPSDPTKVILYSSLEGREVGTYFRGTSRVVNHQAVIEVPEDFRMVTDDDGLTVQLTPVGDLATLAVVSQDLNQIVVKASRDVPFHYLVQGVRRAFKDLQPIRIGYEFVPRSPSDTLQPYLTEEARRRLIANGTYNADGTVNMETAQRLGWVKAWKDQPRSRVPLDAEAARSDPKQ